MDEEDFEEDRGPARPIWWKPRKFNGVLSKQELEEMANADCRFLDPETRILLEPS